MIGKPTLCAFVSRTYGSMCEAIWKDFKRVGVMRVELDSSNNIINKKTFADNILNGVFKVMVML